MWISLSSSMSLDGKAVAVVEKAVIDEILWNGEEGSQMQIKVSVKSLSSSHPIGIIHCEIFCVKEEEGTVTRRNFWQEESPRVKNQGRYESVFYFTPFGDVTVRAWGVDEEGNRTGEVEKTVHSIEVQEEENHRGTNEAVGEENQEDLKDIENIEKDIKNLKRERNLDKDNINKQIEDYVEQNPRKKDNQKPVITVEGVKPYANLREAVSITVRLEDENLDFKQSIISLTEENQKRKVEVTSRREDTGRLELEFYNINQDGKYKLEVIARDTFENEKRSLLFFFLNQTGTRFQLESVIEPYMNRIPDIKIFLQNQKNVSILSCLVNGKKAKYRYQDRHIILDSSDEELWRDGRQKILLTVRDSAGNINQMPPLRFVLDREKPEWNIEGVQEGGVYYSEREIKLSLKDSSDQILAVLLNGQEIERKKGENFVYFSLKKYGKWQLTLKAKDKAGNYGEAKICFFIKPYRLRKSRELSFSHICYLLSILLFVTTSIILKIRSRFI